MLILISSLPCYDLRWDEVDLDQHEDSHGRPESFLRDRVRSCGGYLRYLGRIVPDHPPHQASVCESGDL